jgi:hypothetical protein
MEKGNELLSLWFMNVFGTAQYTAGVSVFLFVLRKKIQYESK